MNCLFPNQVFAQLNNCSSHRPTVFLAHHLKKPATTNWHLYTHMCYWRQHKYSINVCTCPAVSHRETAILLPFTERDATKEKKVLIDLSIATTRCDFSKKNCVQTVNVKAASVLVTIIRTR